MIQNVVGLEICSFLGDSQSPLQSAYCKDHSMETEFTCVLNDIRRSLDYCHDVVLVILDWIWWLLLMLFIKKFSYLSSDAIITSNPCPVNFGIPEGSTLSTSSRPSSCE